LQAGEHRVGFLRIEEERTCKRRWDLAEDAPFVIDPLGPGMIGPRPQHTQKEEREQSHIEQ
jgi:hypothetical protein